MYTTGEVINFFFSSSPLYIRLHELITSPYLTLVWECIDDSLQKNNGSKKKTIDFIDYICLKENIRIIIICKRRKERNIYIYICSFERKI